MSTSDADSLTLNPATTPNSPPSDEVVSDIADPTLSPADPPHGADPTNPTSAVVTTASTSVNGIAVTPSTCDGSASATADISASQSQAAPSLSPHPSLPTSPIDTQALSQQNIVGSAAGGAANQLSEHAGLQVTRDIEKWSPLLQRLWPLLQNDLGPQWGLCLARFVDFERHTGFLV
jgi:hypothetical protein